MLPRTGNQAQALKGFLSTNSEAGPTQFRTIKMLARRSGLSELSTKVSVRQLQVKGYVKHPTKEWMGLARRQGDPLKFWMLTSKGQKALQR